MELKEVVEFARNFSVLVRINGPDPKALKMRNHAFHLYHSGKTTLSASGFLLPRNLRNVVNCGNGAIVVTVASVLEPFLSQKNAMISVQEMPELIPGAGIDVMVEVKEGTKKDGVGLDDARPKWFGAQVLRLVDVPASSFAIQSLIEASSGSSEHHWEVGWSLAAHSDSSQKFKDSKKAQAKSNVTSSGIQRDVNLIGKVATRMAFLLLPSLPEDLPEAIMSPTNKRGDFLLSVGSPFGILSPVHFFNSISVGLVANCYPSMSTDRSLLMADIRCLPGMEGGPVFDQHACLVGILYSPLRQSGGAEIQVVIPWKAIEGAWNDLFQSLGDKNEKVEHIGNCSDAKTAAMNSPLCRVPSNFLQNHPASCCSAPLAVEQAMNCVCLITLDSGVWASGILLNKQGLILTNAHLLEPWRFGRTTIQTALGETRIKKVMTLLEGSIPQRHAEGQNNEVLQSTTSESLDYLHKRNGSQPLNHTRSQISVRVDVMNSWIWCSAKVLYVSKGPLDISLLLLESVPDQLCAIGVNLTCPSPGSRAFVIGHGLLGPRCDLLPSISSGVVSKVVKAKMDLPHKSALQESLAREIPVMLETTASVHPGGSGGAVVSSSGHMIALVTSNAKHGGGTIIPHMNFSIPSAALEPLFIFAKDMQNSSLLQKLDRPNKDLASVWAMMPKISPEPDPLLRIVDDLTGKDKEKQGKGSQFAKFINERQELFRKSRLLNATEDLSRDTIPSKL